LENSANLSIQTISKPMAAFQIDINGIKKTSNEISEGFK
jgi:hypothetical protein